MSAPPDPPPPPDPRERLPREGSPAAFTVHHPKDRLVGVAFTIFAALGLMAFVDDPGRLDLPGLLGAIIVTGIGLSYTTSPFLVRRIAVDGEVLSFHPIGFELRLKDVVAIEWARGDAQQGLVTGMGLLMQPRRLRWLPGRLLWVGRRCGLRLLGTDGAALHAALSDAIGSRPGSVAS